MNDRHDVEAGTRWQGQPPGWDPMSELQALRADVARLTQGRPGPPEVELVEITEGWEVVVRLPGVAPEEVAIELDDRELCVRARTEAEVNAEQGIPGGMETRGFEYRLNLPSQVDPDAVDAVMDHGLLRVRVPRASRPAPRTITVGPPAPAPGGTDTVPPTTAEIDPAADRELHRPDVDADAVRRRMGESDADAARRRMGQPSADPDDPTSGRSHPSAGADEIDRP